MGSSQKVSIILIRFIWRRHWFEDASLPLDWKIRVSDDGWSTTDKIGVEWVKKYIISLSRGRSIGR